MTGNVQKTHYVQEINRFAEKKVLDQLQLTGKALPCHVVAVSGSIVTVKFDIISSFTLPNVTCPMFGPEWIRYPTQVGDLGVVLSADTYIGNISGLGGGVGANLVQRANLSSLIWLPIANVNWSATDDANKLVLYGPGGAVLRTQGSESAITVDSSKATVTSNGNTLTVDSSNVRTSSVFQAGNGASGTFTSQDGKTITVAHGIITSIV